MNLKYKYWIFPGQLSHKFCDEVIKLGNKLKEEKGLTGSVGKNVASKEDHSVRNSSLTWLNELWIYREIQNYVVMANKVAGWNFKWDSSEDFQFTKYKLNQHYDWHCDSSPEPYKDNLNKLYNGKIRKLSTVLSLSNPKDYKGGSLQFQFSDHREKAGEIHECEQLAEKGSLVVFPSHIYHRVTPVTEGKRYSLVNWHLGKPFV